MKSFLIYMYFVVAFLLGGLPSYAQQFNWVKGGGTNADLSTMPSSHDWEAVKYMCSDQQGNVYAASLVGNATVYADTFSGITYGQYHNILITSYNCSGQMRWAKLITGTSWGCTPFGIAADSLGHIYLAGQIPGGTLHIGTDTTLPGAVYERIGLIQFDTNGHYKWIRYAGDNTLSTFNTTGTASACLAIDNMNNAHFIPYIYSGATLMPGVTSQYGTYDLTYNPSGTLLSADRLPLDSTLTISRASIDKQSNKLYVCGSRSPAFLMGSGGDSSYHCYLAEFSATHSLLWMDTIGSHYPLGTAGFTGIAPDGMGHLYLCGEAFGNLFYNGLLITPPLGATGIFIGFTMKTDTAGNMEWIKQCDGHTSVVYNDIVLMPGNKVAATGTVGGLANIGIDSIISSTSYSPFITVLDSSSTLIALQLARGNGYQNWGNAIAVDTVGNLYVGGMVTDSLPDTLITAYHSIGGNTDFYVLKYGVDCSCTSMPVATFTHTGVGTLHLNYTGTTSGLDSVVWNFGDGTIGHGLTAVHTYTVIGTVDVCVTVYTSCGYDIKCSDVVVNCPSTPVASFTSSGVQPMAFTYTGTTIGLDSVVWAFGDGGTGTGTNPSHSYAATGNYTVCVTVYTACGSNTACRPVSISCVAAPDASFTDTGTTTVGFTYGGTAATDSIVWSYGDGGTDIGHLTSHTYNTSGTYQVCATAYNACGNDSVCHTITVQGLGVVSITIDNVRVYPNPAMDELTVTGITASTAYRMLSVTGVSLQSGMLHIGTNTVSVNDYAPGIYLLELTGQGSEHRNVRVVKE